MENDKNYSQKMMGILKALLVAYLATSVLLALLAFLVYRLDLSENIANVSILIIYVVSNAIGGFAIGKWAKEKKYLWGIFIGILYFMLLVLITLGVHRTVVDGDIVTIFILCVCSGTVGGMVS